MLTKTMTKHNWHSWDVNYMDISRPEGLVSSNNAGDLVWLVEHGQRCF